MMKIFCFILFACTINILADTPLNEIPMYGGIDNLSAYYQEINNKFVESVLKKTSREEGSMYFVKKGWEALSKKDYKFSMKKFNQAWLLNDKNPDVYWGFANLLGLDGKFSKAIRMFKMYIEFGGNDIYALSDMAYTYTLSGLVSKAYGNLENMKENLNQAILIIKKALEINRKEGQLYYRWAVCLFHLGRSEEALVKINLAIKYGEEVPEEFIDILKEKKD